MTENSDITLSELKIDLLSIIEQANKHYEDFKLNITSSMPTSTTKSQFPVPNTSKYIGNHLENLIEPN